MFDNKTRIQRLKADHFCGLSNLRDILYEGLKESQKLAY